MTFQQLIYTLVKFWEKRGCIIHQGHDLETGAGTFNPATFLRALGPEPYSAAYVEPSRRPKDGRYGENPNRIQLFHQFQVVIKPSPVDIQKTYLQSLEAIGLDLRKHDVRFVHDDWESPTLGAHGLGWEVWVDGMEVSQFTYFQTVASLPLKPISVELTYGLERLATYIQNVDTIFDVKWNDELTFRDIIMENEVEWSSYNFIQASTEMWLKHFDDYEKEAKLMISRNLPIPAYDFVIKASHAFNVLEARAILSTTERTGYIARIRELARLVGISYLTNREKLGFPLLAQEKIKEPKISKQKKLPHTFNPKTHKEFLFEIGSEQLPATFVPIGMQNLKKAMQNCLDKNNLSYKNIQVFGTPRRLSIYVEGLSEGTPDRSYEKKGPAMPIAFDKTQKLTDQGRGFFKSIGISSVTIKEIREGKIPNLEITKIKDQEYLLAKIHEKGKSIYEILSIALPKIILDLEFPHKMRWANLDISYARPIHWIVALYGNRTIPFQVGDIFSDRFTFGHAQRSDKKISLRRGSHYFNSLKKHWVIPDVDMRKERILNQLQKIEKKIRGKAIEIPKLLPEVVHLSEWPELTSATFDSSFLEIPSEVLISEMVEHQKYFPVTNLKQELTSYFIVVADNGPTSLIRKGYKKVITARFNDGKFLYEQDLKIPLEKFNEKLKLMTFQKDLGTMLDKVMRLVEIAEIVNGFISLADQKKIMRAALLCKTDLATELVGEFPNLQGTVGKYYATQQKEDPEVAQAIEEHWWPKSEQGLLPTTGVGIILSISDKIDNLLAYFAIGLKPTASSDPYSLRRQTIGLIKILIQNRLSISLKELLQQCIPCFAQFKDPLQNQKIIKEILEYIQSREKGVLEEKGYKKDEVEAALSYPSYDPFDQFCKVQALHEFRSSSLHEFSRLYEVYKRAKGQLEKTIEIPFNPSLILEPAEKELLSALENLERKWQSILSERRYVEAFHQMAKLQTPLANLFDHVKILADDPNVRNNRISLLQKVFSLFIKLLDFSKIQS
ncbi:MAG: glycine--tRNA ligase subunit beta [Chlamydiae bacterium]|nr:glycine--tRNA ligase subunit beta [Chlamydiota bacterium]